MSVLDRVAGWLNRRGWRQRARAALATSRAKAMVHGRPTVAAGLKPSEALSEWSLLGRTYGEYRDVLQTLMKIRDYNPDASLAVWNVLRLANPGHQVEVYFTQPGADGQPVPDERGKAIVEELAARVGAEYGGGLDQLLNVLNLTLITQGAVAAELSLSENLREVIDYCPVDPRSIEFVLDKETLQAVPVVVVSGHPERLNTNQFRYMPLDPDVGDPHGRSPLWSTLEIVFFQQEVMRDLKAVMHNQGYPRMDVAVLEEIVVQNTPEHLKAPGSEEEFRTWVDGFLSDLQTTYNSLQPDDTFIHWDWVKVGYVQSGGQGGAVDVAKVIGAIDTMMVASLKQLPVLLGRNEGSTTTHATVQWQIYVAGIEALQRVTKRLVEWMHNTALRVYGRPSYARVTFEEIRKADREAEARAAQAETQTLVTQVQAGWISNDEAAEMVAGHPAVGVMSLVPLRTGTMLLPGAGGSQQKAEEEQPEEEAPEEARAGSRARPRLQPGLQPVAPDGVPDWLWDRAQRTGLAYQRWAENSFGEKMGEYLSGEDRPQSATARTHE